MEGSSHPHASNVGAGLVQKRNHMPPLRNRALQTGIECVAGEEGEEVGECREARTGSVVIDDGLEALYAANGF